jgi:uncharacterized protein
LKVNPRSSKTRLSGLAGDAVKICVAAPPVDNKANREIIDHLSELFGIPRSGIRILSGGSSRLKRVFIAVPQEVFLSRL